METSIVIDEKVIERATKGDKEAYSMLVRGTGQRALFVAERILRSPEDAVSAAVNLFVTAYGSIRKLKKARFLEVWLLQILVSLCSDMLKEMGVKGRAVATSAANTLAGGAAIGRAGAVSTKAAEAAKPATTGARMWGQRRNAVRQAVENLPFVEQTALMFRDWDGVSSIEVAEILRSRRERVLKLLIKTRQSIADTVGITDSSLPQGSEGVIDSRKQTSECRKNANRVWLLVGGELGVKEERELLAHLAECPLCQSTLRKASATLEEIRFAAPVADDPPIGPDTLWKKVEVLLET